MYEMKDMPFIPGQNERPVQKVTGDALKAVGANGSAFALHTGDVINFPEGEPLVVSQQVSGSTAKQYFVACDRNGKKSWLGIGILTRRDYEGKPLGKFQEEMLKESDFTGVYSRLAGKSIKGGESRLVKLAKFDNGNRVEGAYNERPVPEILWN